MQVFVKGLTIDVSCSHFNYTQEQQPFGVHYNRSKPLSIIIIINMRYKGLKSIACQLPVN